MSRRGKRPGERRRVDLSISGVFSVGMLEILELYPRFFRYRVCGETFHQFFEFKRCIEGEVPPEIGEPSFVIGVGNFPAFGVSLDEIEKFIQRLGVLPERVVGFSEPKLGMGR